MGVNDPTPTILGNGAAVTPSPTSSAKLASDDLPVFIGGMMPESAIPVQPGFHGWINRERQQFFDRRSDEPW
jgi:hypothetical protein